MPYHYTQNRYGASHRGSQGAGLETHTSALDTPYQRIPDAGVNPRSSLLELPRRLGVGGIF